MEKTITITITESEAKTLKRYLDNAIIDAKGLQAIGVGSKTSVKNLESIKKKLSN